MTSSRNKSRGLGRGLSSLMADVSPVTAQEPSETSNMRRPDLLVPIEKLQPNPDQPRRHFDEDALEELASSIRTKGIIQPLIVRQKPNGDYEIVAGERRWRASQRAGLHEVPVLVREFSDTEVLEVAIIENIQRADLNAIDEATGYRQLMDRFGHRQEDIATALGKSRSHIANILRLLSLPDEIQAMVTNGKLSSGHARTLIGRDDAVQLAQKVIKNGLSVRETERLVQKAKQGPTEKKPRRSTQKDADTVQIEQELSAHLRMGVEIEHKPGQNAGRMIISYKSLAQLDDLLRALSGD